MQGFVDKLNGMDEGTKNTIVTIGLLAAAIGPVLIIIGKVVSAVGSIMRIPYRGDHRLNHIQHGCNNGFVKLEPRHDERLYHIKHSLEDVLYPFP